jgi:hypothetical protein
MKIITKNQFRLLLTLSIVAWVLSTAASFLNSRLLPQPLLDYQQSQHGVRPKAGELVIMLLGIPGVIGAVISVVGLYQFRPFGRWLNVAAWAYLLVWMCFSPGPVLCNAVSASFSDCSILLAGAVLAVVFFSPAADWFQKKQASP